MPLHRDYLMRTIQRLADAFFRILAGKAVEQPEEARDEIEQALSEVLGVAARYVMGQGPAAMDTLDEPVAAEVGRLLLLHAKTSERVGDSASMHRASAMALAALNRALDPPYSDRTELAAEQLSQHLDPLRTLLGEDRVSTACLKAFEWQEAQKQWAEAENWLFRALDLSDAHRERALAFYDRLLSLDDATLVAGGLPRKEVEESRLDVSKPG